MLKVITSIESLDNVVELARLNNSEVELQHIKVHTNQALNVNVILTQLEVRL